MNYYLDTEFIEGTQRKRFGRRTKPTIDLISIALVAEDGREYYAISKDFNLKEAWNRHDPTDLVKQYWIRENVLKPIYLELVEKYHAEIIHAQNHRVNLKYEHVREFTYKSVKWLINRYGKRNIQIANDICAFIYGDDCGGSGMSAIEMACKYEISDPAKNPIFYAYFADYDWVVLCWLFGKMKDLPKGFPYYCRDLNQMLDDRVEKLGNHHFLQYFHIEKPLTFTEKMEAIKNHNPKYPAQTNEHSALPDARWNKKLHEFIETL